MSYNKSKRKRPVFTAFANTTKHPAARPMVGQAVMCVGIAKRIERIGQPDTGTGGPPQE